MIEPVIRSLLLAFVVVSAYVIGLMDLKPLEAGLLGGILILISSLCLGFYIDKIKQKNSSVKPTIFQTKAK